METCIHIRRCHELNKIYNEDKLIFKLYQILYCEAGSDKIRSCKRLQLMNRTGRCPSYILPDSVFFTDKLIS
jgi:hypothetical protein